MSDSAQANQDTAAANQDTAALIVFGQAHKGARHAAWFTTDESASVRRAATLRSLAVIDPIPESLNDSIAKIARGRFVVGQISLSKVPPEIYAKLLDRLQAQNAEKKAEAPTPPEPTLAQPAQDGPAAAPAQSLPAVVPVAPTKPIVTNLPGAEGWQRLKVGDTVLAPYATADGDGWWEEARIVAVTGDVCRLAWCDGTPGLMQLYKFQIGLLFPRP